MTVRGGTIRQGLRTSVVEAIELRVDGEVVVTDENPRVIPTPSIQVVTAAELPANESLDGSFDRAIGLEIILRDATAETQARLDELADQVEDALGNPVFVQLEGNERTPVAVVYRGMTLELDSQQEDRTGTLTISFSAVV